MDTLDTDFLEQPQMNLLKKIREAKNDSQKKNSEPQKSNQAPPGWADADDTTFDDSGNSDSMRHAPVQPDQFPGLVAPYGPCPECGSPMFWLTVYDPRGTSPRCRGCEPPPDESLVLAKISLLDAPIEWVHGW